MTGTTDPAAYEAWYQTSRGKWIGKRESSLLLNLLQPAYGQTLLDVGCGTGYFSRQFAKAGLEVTGIDPDPAMVNYARAQAGAVSYMEGIAEQLPFNDNHFDYTAAVTSLCFVTEPVMALKEMWRVSRRGVVLGLLNHNSLLYLKKHNRGAYKAARWDTWSTVRQWVVQLTPPAVSHRYKTAILIPNGGVFARLTEYPFTAILPWGGFLAIYLVKPDG